MPSRTDLARAAATGNRPPYVMCMYMHMYTAAWGMIWLDCLELCFLAKLSLASTSHLAVARCAGSEHTRGVCCHVPHTLQAISVVMNAVSIETSAVSS